MSDQQPTLKFNLPNNENLEAYVVKLADGTTVVRTAAELAKIPAKFRPQVIDLAPPKGAK